MGVSPEQRFDAFWKPLASFPRKFSPSQLNYSAYDRESAAVFEAIRYFKFFLEGQIFKLVTDHKPLIFAFNQRSENSSQRERQL